MAEGLVFEVRNLEMTGTGALVVTHGELLIDFVPTVGGDSLANSTAFKKAPGGAPANVAVGVARLGGNSVDSHARTALAFVTLKECGERKFMYRIPSADMVMIPAELDEDLLRHVSIFHYGSISLIFNPRADFTESMAEELVFEMRNLEMTGTGAPVVTHGELLIDFVPTVGGDSLANATAFKKAPGGAPANVAVGVARLGGNSVDSHARTALTFVTLKECGEREFVYRIPSADMVMIPAELDEDLLRHVSIFHYGSISLISEPSRSTHLAAMKIAEDSGALMSFDPNLHLPLWPSPRPLVLNPGPLGYGLEIDQGPHRFGDLDQRGPGSLSRGCLAYRGVVGGIVRRCVETVTMVLITLTHGVGAELAPEAVPDHLGTKPAPWKFEKFSNFAFGVAATITGCFTIVGVLVAIKCWRCGRTNGALAAPLLERR